MELHAIFRRLIAAVAIILGVVAFGNNAQAQVYGTWGYNPATRTWMPPGQTIGTQEVQIVNPVGLPTGAVMVPQGVAAPTGYCSWGDRVINVAASAAIGGALGAIAGGSKAAGRAAAVGGLVGVFIPCQSSSRQNGQVVLAQQDFAIQQGQEHSCLVGGRKILVAARQSCLVLDDAVRAAGGQQTTPQGRPAENRTPVVLNGQTCAQLTQGGAIVRDFLSEDRAVNPLPAPVKTGEECRAAKARYANG